MNGTQTAIDGGINSLCIPRCRFSNEMRWRTAAWSSLFIRQHKIPSTNCLPMSVLLKLFCGCTICWLKIVDGVAGMRPGDKLRTRKSRDDGSATELKKRNIFFCSLAIVPLSLSSFVLKLSLSFFLFIVFLSLSFFLSFFLKLSLSLSFFLSLSSFSSSNTCSYREHSPLGKVTLTEWLVYSFTRQELTKEEHLSLFGCSEAVESKLVKLETSGTVILSTMVSVLLFLSHSHPTPLFLSPFLSLFLTNCLSLLPYANTAPCRGLPIPQTYLQLKNCPIPDLFFLFLLSFKHSWH